MSASKDKIVRKQQIEAGTDKRSLAEQKAAKERKMSNIKYSIVAVVLVLVFAFIFIYNSSLPSRKLTAVDINGEKYTVAQLNYYYSSSYMSFYNNYYTYISYGYFFDTSESLADQAYSEDMTWRDYFLESAVDTMTQVQLLNEEAEAAGYVLPDEYQTEYEDTVASIQSSWADYGYSSLEQYINMNYGKGVTMELIEQELYRTYVASAYSQSVYDGYTYTTDELDEYYTENADSMDVVTYAYYAVDTETMDAQAIADAVNGTTEEAFNAYMAENFEDAAPTTLSYAGSDINTAYSEWLLDSGRQAGDATAIETDSSTYVVMFLDRNSNNYNMTDFRHILFQAEDTDGDGEYSADELAAAQAEAESVYAEWEAGDKTEDSFAELANTNSDDTGSNTVGGLYENVYQNEMVDTVNDWLFDESRQPGDTGIVSYDGTGYTGVHILYYVGASDLTYAQYQADTAMRTDTYNTWLSDTEANYAAVTSNLSLCGKNH